MHIDRSVGYKIGEVIKADLTSCQNLPKLVFGGIWTVVVSRNTLEATTILIRLILQGAQKPSFALWLRDHGNTEVEILDEKALDHRLDFVGSQRTIRGSGAIRVTEQDGTYRSRVVSPNLLGEPSESSRILKEIAGFLRAGASG